MKYDQKKLEEELKNVAEEEERADKQWLESKNEIMQYYEELKTEWGDFPQPDFSGVNLVSGYKYKGNKIVHTRMNR